MEIVIKHEPDNLVLSRTSGAGEASSRVREAKGQAPFICMTWLEVIGLDERRASVGNHSVFKLVQRIRQVNEPNPLGDVVLAFICFVKAFDRDTHPPCKLFLAYLPQNTRHVAQINES